MRRSGHISAEPRGPFTTSPRTKRTRRRTSLVSSSPLSHADCCPTSNGLNRSQPFSGPTTPTYRRPCKSCVMRSDLRSGKNTLPPIVSAPTGTKCGCRRWDSTAEAVSSLKKRQSNQLRSSAESGRNARCALVALLVSDNSIALYPAVACTRT